MRVGWGWTDFSGTTKSINSLGTVQMNKNTHDLEKLFREMKAGREPHWEIKAKTVGGVGWGGFSLRLERRCAFYALYNPEGSFYFPWSSNVPLINLKGEKCFSALMLLQWWRREGKENIKLQGTHSLSCGPAPLYQESKVTFSIIKLHIQNMAPFSFQVKWKIVFFV